ncbi:MAG: chemotaxis protein CheR [Trichlorobacter sp.]|uniref:CheR family methyltransferase n=1 Tax=Trichlorobacter sp. TaxID=2911007 RepID=UPI00256093D8|nr:CheR family methyltransferase [Trichlorobacter sp.]MDK9717903.1 chemotaxis protein CheR [Trichlorobacter sp.]
MHKDSGQATPQLCSMRTKEFDQFSALIYDEVGIKMPPAKKTMLEARLQKRLKALGMHSFQEYSDFIFSPAGRDQEIIHLIDVVTTNKTDFFREPQHFDFLVREAIPTMRQIRGAGDSPLNPFRIWSAGCSTGEEPYTMAMVLSDYAAANHGFKFSILASDICTQVIQTASSAVYGEDRTDTIPLSMKKKYLLRSKDRSKGLVRIAPEPRSSVSFKRVNFMDDQFGIHERQDVIFCRNVVIYFDKQTQAALMQKFHRQLVTGGYLFIGHSETLNGLGVPFTQVANTVYRKD